MTTEDSVSESEEQAARLKELTKILPDAEIEDLHQKPLLTKKQMRQGYHRFVYRINEAIEIFKEGGNLETLIYHVSSATHKAARSNVYWKNIFPALRETNVHWLKLEKITYEPLSGNNGITTLNWHFRKPWMRMVVSTHSRSSCYYVRRLNLPEEPEVQYLHHFSDFPSMVLEFPELRDLHKSDFGAIDSEEFEKKATVENNISMKICWDLAVLHFEDAYPDGIEGGAYLG